MPTLNDLMTIADAGRKAIESLSLPIRLHDELQAALEAQRQFDVLSSHRFAAAAQALERMNREQEQVLAGPQRELHESILALTKDHAAAMAMAMESVERETRKREEMRALEKPLVAYSPAWLMLPRWSPVVPSFEPEPSNERTIVSPEVKRRVGF